MLIRDNVWRAIKDRFTATETTAIEQAITGRIICPAGAEVDIDALGRDLIDKLVDALEAESYARAKAAGR